MLLNEKELKIILEFALEPILKQYSVHIKEAHLFIDDKINIQSIIQYQEYVLDLKASFLLDYCQHQLCFTNIQGKVEYLFLQLNIMNILKKLLNHENIKINDDSCFYNCLLPIETIQLNDHCLDVQLK